MKYKEFIIRANGLDTLETEEINRFLDGLDSLRGVEKKVGGYYGREQSSQRGTKALTVISVYSVNGNNVITEIVSPFDKPRLIIDGENEEHINRNLNKLKEIYPKIDFLPIK